MGRSHAPSSSPITFTSSASSRTPASASTSARLGPVHSAQPIAPVPHWLPAAVRPVTDWKNPRQFPAHSIYAISVWLGSAFRSSRVSETSVAAPGPPTVSTYEAGSITGVGAWLRTKKRSLGVSRPSRSSRRVSRLVPCWTKRLGSFTQIGLAPPPPVSDPGAMPGLAPDPASPSLAPSGAQAAAPTPAAISARASLRVTNVALFFTKASLVSTDPPSTSAQVRGTRTGRQRIRPANPRARRIRAASARASPWPQRPARIRPPASPPP